MEASQHRLRARESLRGNWLTAILVALVASLLTSGVDFHFTLNVNSGDLGDMVSYNLPSIIEYVLVGIVGVSTAVLLVLGAALFIVNLALGGVISMGSAKYNLNLIDGKEADFSDLFSQFPGFSQALVMHLLTNLFVLLWSLLLIVPGIVASYRYAMAPYILLEDPSCTGGQAIQRSKEMMDGHKGELFWLDLTFLGWSILCAFTLGLGNLALNPYKAASRASFYRNLTRGEQ